MDRMKEMMASGVISAFTGLLLAVLFAVFAYSHFLGYKKTGDLVLLLVIVSEILQIVFYLARHDPKSVSSNIVDWLLAFSGSFAPLFFSPADFGVMPEAKNIMFVGVAMQIYGLLCLNRSFALVAAKREIKTEKIYRIVRHPIYASYLITFTAYLFSNTTIYNAIVYGFFMCFMLMRIVREERHLSKDSLYREYMSRVRYRLIPFVY